MNMTDLEKKVYDFIKDNSDIENMDCVEINDLVEGCGENAKILRGVISSLVKKNMIYVEEYDFNFKIQYFYWLKDAFNK